MTGFPKTLSDFKQSQAHFYSFHSKREWKSLFEDQARAYLKHLDFFSKKTEDWRWFPLQKIMNQGFVFHPPSVKKKALPEKRQATGDQTEDQTGESTLPVEGLFPSSLVLSFQNGQLVGPALKQKECLVFSWTDFLNGKVEAELSSDIKQKILSSLKEQRNPLCSLNNALCSGGYILILRSALKQTLEIHFSHDLKAKKQGFNLRNFIFAEDHSSAQIVEFFHGASAREQNKALFLNIQTDVFIGKAAQLKHICLDRLQEPDSLIHQLFSPLSEKALAWFLHLSLNAGLSRYSTQIQQEEKSSSEIRGLSLLMDKRQADHKVYVSHREPGGRSQQSYLAFLSDHAKHIFKGCISIEQKAQETAAGQICKSFLLSDRAFSVSSPELDVVADNVKASHGATVSSFEESKELIFYLQSRGIEPKKALQMFISGLVRESLDFLSLEEQKTLQVFLEDQLEQLAHSTLNSKALL